VELGGFANVNDVFAPDRGFVVGEGDGMAAVLEGEERDFFGRKVAGIDLIVMGFGDVPILAEETAHVASGGAHAEDFCAWEEMAERLFLDGVHLERGGGGVTEAEEFAVFIDADETETGLAGADVTMARAEIAVDTVVGFGSPPEGFVEGGGFLEDLEGGHGGCVLGLVYAWGGGGKRGLTQSSQRTQRSQRRGERLGAGAHYAAALGGPVGETAEVFAVFPGELEEFSGVEVGGFFAEEGFKAPLEIGTVPGLQAIATGGYPVVAERLPHGGIVHGRKCRCVKK